MSGKQRFISWILWPFRMLWRLIGRILKLTGRFVAAVLGIVFMAAGILLSATVVGAIIGIPLVIFGFLLMLRSIF